MGFIKRNNDNASNQNIASQKRNGNKPNTLAVGSGNRCSCDAEIESLNMFLDDNNNFYCTAVKSFCEANALKSYKQCASMDIIKKLAIEINDFSKIYRNTHTVKYSGECAEISNSLCTEGILTVLKHKDNLGRFIQQLIERSISSNKKEAIYIKSPLGSYKNMLLQLIYLYTLGSSTKVLPVYINLSHYENRGANIDELIKKLKHIAVSAKKNSKKMPFFIFDSVRLFECGMGDAYKKISDLIKDPDIDFRILTAADTLYTAANRRYNTPFAGGDNYKYETNINISSANLDKKEQSSEFIKSCLDYFFNGGKYLPMNADGFREYFINLGLVSLDAYIVKKIISILIENFDQVYEGATNIGIYSKIIDAFDDSCYRSVFTYNYDKDTDCLANSDRWWHTVMKHRSVFDFCVAKYYFQCLRGLLEGSKDFSQLPDTVTNNSVNRFLVGFFNDNDNNWVDFIEFINSSLSQQGSSKNFCSTSDELKAQLCFLIGRTSLMARKKLISIHKDSNDFISDLLTSLKKDFSASLEKANDDYDKYLKAINATREKEPATAEHKQELRSLKMSYFVMRTAEISMIKCGCIDALNEYLCSLLSDKIASEVNRGYHIDYYGDVPYQKLIKNESQINLSDIPDRGINAMHKLSIKIESALESFKAMPHNKSNGFILALNLFTYCDLIRTRKFKEEAANIFYLSKHQADASRYLKDFCAIIERNDSCLSVLKEELKDHFIQLRDLFDKTTYNRYTNNLSVTRTGWIERRVPEKSSESIATHMYNAFLMGRVFLPESYCEAGYDGEYNKRLILELLLIHDLGEAEVGDNILKDDATRHRELRAMKSFLTTYYPTEEANELLGLWINSESSRPTNINAKIAKELDRIQAVYQYCKYCAHGDIFFTPEDYKAWTDGLSASVSTAIGRQICSLAIFNNPEFSALPVQSTPDTQ